MFTSLPLILNLTWGQINPESIKIPSQIVSVYLEVITNIKNSLINPSFKYVPKLLPPEVPQLQIPNEI